MNILMHRVAYIAAVTNPTNLDSAAESSANSTAADPSLAPPPAMIGDGGNVFGDPSYEVFDPLAWTLDGLVDFPFGFSDGSVMT